MDYTSYYSLFSGSGIQIFLVIIPIVLVAFAQIMLRRQYAKYSQVQNSRNMTGLEAARRILDSFGLQHVEVYQGQGQLSDYYDPRKNIIMLSPDVYSGNSIASLAIAAHEVGHAIQYATKYPVIGVRQKVLPLSMMAGNLAWIVIMAGLIFSSMSSLLWIGIGMLCLVAIFQVLTLPLEFNASNRALHNLENLQLLSPNEIPAAQKVLRYAALTYVVALITTLAQVLRLVLIARNRD
ncbi:MAG: zinc metallopeptidase [Bacilli bacterium]|jgi:Zn-dependent membrane protease YugP|nr:zinc metallopeptidase [Bacilli bacterium]